MDRLIFWSLLIIIKLKINSKPNLLIWKSVANKKRADLMINNYRWLITITKRIDKECGNSLNNFSRKKCWFEEIVNSINFECLKESDGMSIKRIKFLIKQNLFLNIDRFSLYQKSLYQFENLIEIHPDISQNKNLINKVGCYKDKSILNYRLIEIDYQINYPPNFKIIKRSDPHYLKYIIRYLFS